MNKLRRRETVRNSRNTEENREKASSSDDHLRNERVAISSGLLHLTANVRQFCGRFAIRKTLG